MLKLYPHIKGLVDQSLSFTNLHVTTPFCAPSRAALFRGQYAHRTGVRVNIPDYPLSLSFRGGYSEFLRQKHEQEELGVWVRRAGYHTMMIGKYHHNGFDFKIPPGWDDFYMSNGGRYMGTYRFTNRDNRDGGHSKNPDDVYRTDQEKIDAIRLIKLHTEKQTRQSAANTFSIRRKPKLETMSSTTSNGSQPFFLYLAPLAPHRPVGNDFTNMVDKARYDGWHPELRIPKTPDFDTAPLSDKPPHRQSPPYTEAELDLLHLEYLSRARAVKSVDDLWAKSLRRSKPAVFEDQPIFSSRQITATNLANTAFTENSIPIASAPTFRFTFQGLASPAVQPLIICLDTLTCALPFLNSLEQRSPNF